MILFFYMMAAYGMTSILVYGSILESPREWIKKHSKFWGDLLSCVLCTSTWVGFFMSLFLGSISTQYFDTIWIINLFFDGMFTSGSVWAINAIIDWYEENRIK